MGRQNIDRRDFLKKAAAATVVTSLGNKLSHAEASSFPYRTLGRTGEKVSLIGIGGYHLGRWRSYSRHSTLHTASGR
jgi:uncharacterized protein